MTALYNKDLGNPFPLPPSNNRVGQFFTQIESEFNLFESFGVKQYGELYLVSVNPDYRGQGLGLEMGRRAVDTLKSIGVTVIMSLASSPFGDTILTQLGFETRKSWTYRGIRNDARNLRANAGIGGNVLLKILIVPKKLNLIQTERFTHVELICYQIFFIIVK